VSDEPEVVQLKPRQLKAGMRVRRDAHTMSVMNRREHYLPISNVTWDSRTQRYTVTAEVPEELSHQFAARSVSWKLGPRGISVVLAEDYPEPKSAPVVEPEPAQLSYRIVSYWKRKRGEPGLTQRGSVRLDAADTINWILNDLPDEASEISFGEDGWTTVRLHMPTIAKASPVPSQPARRRR
jgi:hypothetical protein